METRKPLTEFKVDERIELLGVLTGDMVERVPPGRDDGSVAGLPSAVPGHRAGEMLALLLHHPAGLEHCLDLFLAMTKPPTICVDIAVALKLWPDLSAGWCFDFGESVQDFCLQSGFSAWFESRSALHHSWVNEARQVWASPGRSNVQGLRQDMPGGENRPESDRSGMVGVLPDPPDIWLLSAWDLEVPDRILSRRGRQLRVRISGYAGPLAKSGVPAIAKKCKENSNKQGAENEQESA